VSKKIRILFGLEAAGGGALKHLVYLATNLQSDLFDITVIVSPRSNNAIIEIDKMAKLGIHVIKMPMIREISLMRDMNILVKIYYHLRSNKYDIVHSHSSKAGVYFRIAAFLNNVRVILHTPHSFYFQSKKGIRKVFFKKIEKILTKITDQVIVSENEMQHFVTNEIGAADKLININNAINFKDYIVHDKNEMVHLLGLSRNSIVIGAIGRLVEQKGYHTLVNVAHQIIKKFPDTIFIIGGDGEMKGHLNDAIKRLGMQKKIILLGHYEEVSKLYSAIDIFVSTSLWEGLPYALLEAMWYSKPIVATNLGYERIICDNEYLVENEDTNLFLDRLSNLIQSERLRMEIGKKNRLLVEENFSFTKFVEQHQKLYLKKHYDKVLGVS
jgi:glycosyltransferase involved in cell wall biosynthesis